MGRIEGMTKRCKKIGGSGCECIGEDCSLRVLAIRQIDLLDRSIESLKNTINRIDHTPCTVRDTWRRPEKPDGDYQLTAVHDGDGWYLGWYSDTESDDWIPVECDREIWPFNEHRAFGSDWEKLGIQVEIG